MFQRIRKIEEDGGSALETRNYWTLSNHSGGDTRFPTCGARHSILKRFSAGDASRILSSTDEEKTSTPVKVYRAKLRRPSTWSSMDDVFSPKGEDSGYTQSPAAKADTGASRSVIGLKQVIDLGAVGGETKKEVVPEVEDYPLSHIWDSDQEEARVKAEAQCSECSR